MSSPGTGGEEGFAEGRAGNLTAGDEDRNQKKGQQSEGRPGCLGPRAHGHPAWLLSAGRAPETSKPHEEAVPVAPALWTWGPPEAGEEGLPVMKVGVEMG